MSYGVCICSKCQREVHQGERGGGIRGREHYWFHCDDKGNICSGATAVYAESRSQIKGKFCLADECGTELKR